MTNVDSATTDLRTERLQTLEECGLTPNKRVIAWLSKCPETAFQRYLEQAMERRTGVTAPASQPQTQQTQVASGVFWGLFHFFITLPVFLLVGCGACVSYLGSQ